jgi:hypothetical protein
MLTADEFRRLALSMPGAIEGAHMGHPDFRANGRIFATLRRDGSLGMVKLPPEQQRRVLRETSAFTPSSGAWGRQGCTDVDLAAADRDVVAAAMHSAWQAAMELPPPRKKTAAAPRRRRKHD